MDASTFEQPLPAALASRAAAGHTADGQRLAGDAHVYPEQAAAGLWTTPGDLARFALALHHSLTGDGGLLKRDTANALITPPLAGSDYGLGLGVIGEGDALQLTHSGSNEGFRCSFVYYPRTGRGAIIMTNSDNGGALIPEILRSVSREYHWPDYGVVEKTAVSIPDSYATALFGYYQRESTTMIVFRSAGHFYLKIGEQPRVEIFPQSNHEFFTLGSSEIWSFERSGNGMVSHVILRSSPPQLYRRLR